MSSKPFRVTCIALTLVVMATKDGLADDWPMWRHDAGRSAVSAAQLPEKLHVLWSRELGTPAPAWPREQGYHGKLEFDRTYQPIVLGKRIIVPSMVSDCVTAYDTETGREAWRFYANGPVRFAPVGHNDRIYFGSDDGHLYCVNAVNGQLAWKVRGGPDSRAILGNQRLISSWPVRGAPVLANGRVYFGAGIWPFMGIFIHAVDAESGKLVWTNSGTGAIYNLHQHGGADAFGGVAPQGYMAVQGNHLVVAGGLTVPAIFACDTGEFLRFEQAHHIVGKGTGGFDVAAHEEFYFNGGKLFSFVDGKPRLSLGIELPLVSKDQITVRQENELVRFSLHLESTEVVTTDRKGKTTKEIHHSLRELRRAELPLPTSRLLMQVGTLVFVSLDDGSIAALEWSDAGDQINVVWRENVRGIVHHALAGDDRLFVVTHAGLLYCFGADVAKASSRSPLTHRLAAADDQRIGAASADASSEVAETILRESGETSGIALVWGLDSGRMVKELIRQSSLFVIAVDDDERRVDRLRRQLDDAGLYGRRAQIVAAEPHEFPFPPYLARLVVSERLEATGWSRHATDRQSSRYFQRLFHTLQPYGGTAWLPVSTNEHASFVAQVDSANLPNAKVTNRGGFASLVRVGALPGAGQWTHQYGSSANTVFSGDKRVKAPLGLLWFGGPTNHDVLPRHGQGPIPHVVAGRLIIEGVNSISARCVYTGRTLWRREFTDIGFPYKANNHSFTETVYINNQPGANYIGSNYVSVSDGVYVVYQDECHRLDLKTGRTFSKFQLPTFPGEDEPASWGYIGVWGDYLVAGASPQVFDDGRIGEKNWNATSSRRVVVMNRYDGTVLWTQEADYGYRHNAIVPVANKLFLIDRLSDGALNLRIRRGISSDNRVRLAAYDLRTGQRLWSSAENIFGTWLGYSEEHDVLIQAGRTGGREQLPDEPSNQVIAYRGTSGEILWNEPVSYTGPLVISGDQVISSGRQDGAVNLLTGKARNRIHPITGTELPWTHTRTYGCGTMLACENLLTFRSGAAGFYDFASDGGTGNFGGFKAGCTPNLVPADGVLNAPDYTRTCTCSYQNQTSLALIHQPDIEIWTYSTLPSPEGREAVQRIGINLNAPGDRRAEDGTLWVEYPSVAGPSPDIPVEVTDGNIHKLFRSHSAMLHPPLDTSVSTARTLPWVAASGLEGAVSLKLTLQLGSHPQKKSYRVRLHFVEPETSEPGRRVFSVSLQGERVETDLDVAERAGGSHRPLVREYSGIAVTGALHVQLHSTAGSLPPTLSGIEVVREASATRSVIQHRPSP